MSWILSGFGSYSLGVSDPAGRAVNQSSGQGQVAQERTLDSFRTGCTYEGVVIRAGAGMYDAVVRTIGGPEVACMVMVGDTNYYFGTCDCNIPVEGSRVLIYKPYTMVNVGVIMGVLPSADTVSPLDSSDIAPATYYQMWDVEPGKSAMTEDPYREPWASTTERSINANAGRPQDVFPGNKAWINEQGVGLAIFNLLAALRGSEKAKIEVSAIDDAVRVVSGYFRHITTQGEDQIYNDGGFLTREILGTSYQCEKSGYTNYGPALFTKETGELLDQASKARYKLAEEKIASKRRFQVLVGYLGDIINLFVANPDPDQNPEKSDTDSKDQGLLHMHVDSSGRMLLRSAAGVSFQRDDIIPVPKKKHQPWDPEGDKLSPEPGAGGGAGADPDFVKEKKPFEWDAAYPYARSLQMRDALAYRNMQAVQRIYNQSTGDGMKDYFIPEEKDMETPADEYDKRGKAKEDFSKNKGRKAYFNLEDDGSIVMRDAWGSEIILRGGNIIVNCPGEVQVRSGGSIVQLAGHDIIAKARKSVDITATDRDVRIKANTNLHMVSEGRVGPDARGGGGILLESKATSEIEAFDGVTGEQVRSSGIILKAKNSRVYMEGKRVHMSGHKNIIMETFNEDGDIDGDILMSAKNIYTAATRQNIFTTGDEVGLILTNRQAIVAAPTAMVLAGRSLILTRGAKAWIPLTEADIGSNPYDTAQSAAIQLVYDILQDDDAWLKPFDPTARKDIEFTYRSSEEYGTTEASEVYGATDFYVYQATWAYLKSVNYEFIDGTSSKWQDYDIEDTYAWPGTVGYDGSPYLKLESETNIEDPAKGIPKIRAELENKPGSLTKKSFSEYEVMRAPGHSG